VEGVERRQQALVARSGLERIVRSGDKVERSGVGWVNKIRRFLF
jgi:hypothetical protein